MHNRGIVQWYKADEETPRLGLPVLVAKTYASQSAQAKLLSIQLKNGGFTNVWLFSDRRHASISVKGTLWAHLPFSPAEGVEETAEVETGEQAEERPALGG